MILLQRDRYTVYKCSSNFGVVLSGSLDRDDALARRDKVALVGFGTFQVMERKARKRVNPQTRETIQIPANKVPKFRPGKGLRDKVR